MMPKQASDKKILVVDDDAGGRRLTRATLVRAGFTVVEAEDGQVALDWLHAHGMPDLILLDVSMPNKDGFETCEALRQMPGAELVPVVMMTGLDDVDSIEKAFRCGANDFITKPINWPILSHRVRYLLRAGEAIRSVNENERRLSNAQRIGEMGDWQWSVAHDQIILSQQAWQILGMDAARTALGLVEFLAAVDEEDRLRVKDAMEQAIAKGERLAVQHRVRRADGSVRHVHQQIEIAARDAEGRATQLIGAMHDVTQRTDAEEQIRRLAYYDTLTGLPNRLLYLQQLQTALSYAQRKSQKVAVMFIDLDNFKRVNDSMGHSAGDELLKIVSNRLVSSIRVLDSVGRVTAEKPELTESPSIARLGGDEFTVMVSDIKTADDAAVVARRLITSLCEPLTINNQEIFVSGSIGVALYPDDGIEIDELLKHADVAMYRAKEEGKGRFHFYDPSMTARAVSRMKTESQLRRCLERNEFVVHYQPRVNVNDGRIVAAEALLRWQHPERGLVFPADFIALCEEAKLVVPVGEWVIRAVCKQQAAWRDAGMEIVPVAVNLAASHLRETGLPLMVTGLLNHYNLPPHAIEIEVTESVLLIDPEISIRTADALASSGVRMALDDFGMGYSSLSYLKRLPVSHLKIDQSFVRDSTTDASDAAIITATIAMAHMLDIQVVAEGVENNEQLEFLRQRGCDEYQGFLHSRPMMADAFLALVQASRQNMRLVAA